MELAGSSINEAVALTLKLLTLREVLNIGNSIKNPSCAWLRLPSLRTTFLRTPILWFFMYTPEKCNYSRTLQLRGKGNFQSLHLVSKNISKLLPGQQICFARCQAEGKHVFCLAVEWPLLPRDTSGIMVSKAGLSTFQSLNTFGTASPFRSTLS